MSRTELGEHATERTSPEELRERLEAAAAALRTHGPAPSDEHSETRSEQVAPPSDSAVRPSEPSLAPAGSAPAGSAPAGSAPPVRIDVPPAPPLSSGLRPEGELASQGVAPPGSTSEAPPIPLLAAPQPVRDPESDPALMHSSTSEAPPRPAPQTQAARPSADEPGRVERVERVAPAAARTPRRARLVLRRIEPLSALKAAFVFSLALALVLVVAACTLFVALAGLGVLDAVNTLAAQLLRNAGPVSSEPAALITGSRVLTGSLGLGVVLVLATTVLTGVATMLYNIAAGFTGGVRVVLADDPE